MFVMGNIWKGIDGGKSGFQKIYGLLGLKNVKIFDLRMAAAEKGK